ncbi:carbonic anhydrase-related protein 10-like isoform X2 [Panonychus citri]|uniref:carbonic anhydrase-related protein 10-like isoform X2 n=1 Tax=Panonychus citri TaxID=50023 RepID=UPI0023080964|nr:carbonic anhydrase-related protein 10-like isoform X2 [Panonychus citri]
MLINLTEIFMVMFTFQSKWMTIIFISVNYMLSSFPWTPSYQGHLVIASWEQWWAYEGISGPHFWGRTNPKWVLCNKGRRQSPIDIDPEALLFDPFLSPLQLIGDHVNGNLINTGRGIIFKVSGLNKTDTFNLDSSSLSSSSTSSSSSPPPSVSLTNGPLTYRYTLNHFALHYGRNLSKGSEHTIGGIQFPGEIQFYAYNSLLYDSYEEASLRAHGVVAVSVLLQISHDPKQANNQLKRITHALKNITTKGSFQKIESLSISEIMPEAMRRQYLTYDGSLTIPGCYETVQWIILNKPIYMTSHLFHSLRISSSTEPSHGGDNFRPIQRLNSRPIRTNINFETSFELIHLRL